MKTVVSIFFSLLLGYAASAQEGGFYLNHYRSQNSGISHDNFDIDQEENGIMYLANRSGVVSFDGNNWNLIPTTNTVFSIEISGDYLYTGGPNGIGKIDLNGDNTYKYEVLSDSTVSDIIDLKITDEFIYGLNSDYLVTHNIETGEQKKIKSPFTGKFYSLNLHNNRLIVQTELRGLQVLNNEKLEEPNAEWSTAIVLSDINSNGDVLWVGYNNSVYFKRNNKTSPLKNSDGLSYAISNIPTSILWVNDTIAAISSMKGGVVFLNPYVDKVNEVLNYESGLPDDEVFATHVDNKNGLWIAHEDGLTRVSSNFPMRTFSIYPGLDGHILTTYEFNNSLYVGTSLGLYRLTEKREYDEEQIRIEVIDTITTVNEPIQQRKGLFSFLKRNEIEPSDSSSEITSRVMYQTKKELKGIHYDFEKIKGLNSKVNQFRLIQDKLYCGGLDGLFQIDGSTASVVTTSPIRYFYGSTHYQKLFINTLSDRFEVYNLGRNEFVKSPLLGDFSDYASQIFEDNDHRIWICSNEEIYALTLDGDAVDDSQTYALDNPFFFDTYGIDVQDTLYFVNENGLFILNQEREQLVLQAGKTPQRYFIQSDESIWVQNQDEWFELTKAGYKASQNLLNALNNIQYINEIDDNYWIVTVDDQLFQLSKRKEKYDALATYDLILHEIKLGEASLDQKSKIRITQDDGVILFEYTQPEYSGVVKLKYSYMIEGLDNVWSEWQENNNEVRLAYLPDGKYKLKMRSYNVITGIENAEPVSFEVLPPYWKRPWFLATEFVGLGLLLFISVRLKKLGYRYRMLSRLLALLTLIIIIEFLQTLAENKFGTETSPVIDFIIQIIVAIIILPVEGLLRKFIFKEKNVRILEFFKIKN